MTGLALGTVQFGLRYGVANQSGQVPVAEAEAILARARQAGMDTLDTAVGYGDSESRLGDLGVSSWRVITKLPPLPDEVADVTAWIEAQVAGSLQRLGLQSLDGLLLHKPADLYRPVGPAYLAALQSLKDRGAVRSCGVSVYDPSELERLWAVWQPDMVQAPCNVLDRRLIRSGWLARLSDCGVRIHLRSAFLQGLLVMPPARRPAGFARWHGVLDRWHAWCAVNSLAPLTAAIGFAQQLPGVERVVVGVDSLAHLEEILAAAAVDAASPPEDLFSDDRDLIDPSRWKLT
jgi:aryl-alcohol dehydrogenase-like predicted oxidoreductase